MISLWRVIQAGTRNFLRNAWLSTAATAVMAVTLTIILASMIANTALTASIRTIVNKIDVSLYLRDEVKPEQVKDLEEQLKGVDNVQSVHFVSKSDALGRYREQNKHNPILLGAVNEEYNPLPASFEVKATDEKRLQPITDFVNQPEVKALLDPNRPTSYEGERKATIDKIVRVSNFIRTAGLVSSLIFIVISVLIIFNTIRMAIFTRREEIEIMKLVGATKWFIRGPFLFEASLYGIIAAIVAFTLVYMLLVVGGPRLSSYIDVNSTVELFSNHPLRIVFFELVIGVTIGITSSALAMVRHLKL